MIETDIYSKWTSIKDEEITAELIHEILYPIPNDLWVAAACVDRVLDNVNVQRVLLELGIERTKATAKRVQDNVESLDSGSSTPGSSKHSASSYFSSHEEAQLCYIRSILLTRQDRLRTFEEILKHCSQKQDPSDNELVAEGWDDDPWADNDPEPSDLTSSSNAVVTPFPLSVFMTEDAPISCLSLASQLHFKPIKEVISRHFEESFPFRFSVLSRIPLFVDPSEFHELLPSIDANTGKEAALQNKPWRKKSDFVESDEVKQALIQAGLKTENKDDIRPIETPMSRLLSGEEIQKWYTDRVDAILSSTGMIDVALSLVQHGVTHGIMGLDEIGEDLSLISRLIYDTDGVDSAAKEIITLSEWSSLEPREIVKRYLAHSKPTTVVENIRRLALPYLFVVESRLERAGKPDSSLIKRLLYDFILNSNLDLVVPIFGASKPTQVASQRLVSDDEDLARLALSCLYGSNSLSSWSYMSQIFECLPAWSSGYDEDNEDEIKTTIASLGSFLAPSTSSTHASPSDLYIFFKPLPASALSRALDLLDIHLEAGETLSRWGAAVPLRWFLQSAYDEKQQRAVAVKMARQADAPSGDLDSEDIWLSLLEDMLRYARPEGSPLINTAFGSLTADTIRQIFFRGLLSTGRFAIARHFVHPRYGDRLLPLDVLETLCLESSREFYDNASSGNYNFGDMKLAYECLGVAKQSSLIQREREFIEATSRISSFNVTSRPGAPILPIEIRLTKDKLSLISRILSSNEEAYKHTEVLLELVRKLGFRDDPLAEVKTLAMIADTALQAEDYERAFAASERMISVVIKIRQTAPLGSDTPQAREAIEVCWVACFQLGRHPEAEDIERRMVLLGRALELCPTDKIVDILTPWRKLEVEQLAARREKMAGRRASRDGVNRRSNTNGKGISARITDSLYMPSPALPSASSLASTTFNRVAAALPFGMHGNRTGEDVSREASPDVQSQARHALRRGVGWLIGADEEEL